MGLVLAGPAGKMTQENLHIHQICYFHGLAGAASFHVQLAEGGRHVPPKDKPC